MNNASNQHQHREHNNNIHQRFERDFLPRYGTLWRNMVEQSGTKDATAGATSNNNHQKHNQPPSSQDASTTANDAVRPMNFMDAIQRKTTMTIKIPPHDGAEDGCACDGCVPPVLEFDDDEEEEDTENRAPNLEHMPLRMQTGQSSMDRYDDDSSMPSSVENSDQEDFIDDDNDDDDADDDDSSHGNTASTPLPTDLAADFGRFLTFGEAEEEDAVQVEATPPPSGQDDDSNHGHTENEAQVHHEEQDEESENYQGSNDESSSSSGSSVVRFDISHILDTTPVNTDVLGGGGGEVHDNIFSEQLRPQFSPPREDMRGENHDPSNSPDDLPVDEGGEGENLPCSEQSSSNDSSIYNVDLSYMVQSPERGQTGETTSTGIQASIEPGGENEDNPPDHEPVEAHDSVNSSDADILQVDGPERSPALNRQNQSIVIDLVDSDDDEVTSFQPNKHQIRNNNQDDHLVDTSDESVAKRTTRGAPAAKHINADDSSEDNEWDGGSDQSSSDLSFESPDDFDDDSDEGTTTDNIRRKSISKLARGTRKSSSFPSGDSENWNPNKPAPSKSKTKSMAPSAFKKNRESLSKKHFQEYDMAAFDGKLASVQVIWSNKLRTTAGLTRLQRHRKDFTPGVAATRVAIIELSTKVLDNPERLQSTLLHEMVHAAAWIIDGVSKPPHGACFKKWANTAMRRIPGVEVTTTHDYMIQYKYAWACTTSGCKFLVQRHSRSVDLKRQCCGRCRGRLIEVDVPDHSSRNNVQKTPKKRAPPSGYNLFVKEHSKTVREQLAMRQKGKGKVSQADVMKECARRWQEKKQLGNTPINIE